MVYPRVDIKPLLDPVCPDVLNHVNTLWLTYTTSWRDDNKWQAGLYENDPTHSGVATFFQVWKPEVYTSTMSYQDNLDVLDRIDEQIAGNLAHMDAVIVVGDQQTFDRMMKLKRELGPMYKHIIPFNGEMHLEAHFCHAGWRLYWEPLLIGFIPAAFPQQKVLKQEWTVKDWSHYDDFLMKFVNAGIRHITSVCPEGCLDVSLLFYNCRNNATSTMYLHFLLDFGVPYVGLRQCLRKTSSFATRKEMQVYYNLCMHMCRTGKANKFLYAMLCVHALYIYSNSVPGLRKVWEQMSTVSLRGLQGRNIPIDHLIEKVNKASKAIVHGRPTAERIEVLVKTLNVLMPVESAYFRMMQTDPSEERKHWSGKQDREQDICRVVETLNNIVGHTWASMTRSRSDNGFRQGFPGVDPSDPWELVSDKQADWASYVDRHIADIGW